MGLGNLFGLLENGIGSNPYASQEQGAANSLGGIASQYGQFGQGQLSQYNTFNPQYQQAVTDESRLLTQNPYTDSYSTQQIANATNTTTSAYQSAKAALQSEMARRGISGGGAETGGLASLAAGQANAISGAANNVAMQSIQQQYKNAAANTGLLGGASSQAQQGYLGTLGAQGNLTGEQGSIYGNLGNQWLNEAEYNNNQNNQLMGLLGGFAGAASSAAGKAFGGKA